MNFQEIYRVLNENDDINAYVYPDGDYDGEVLVVEDYDSEKKLCKLLEPLAREQCKANDDAFFDYEDFPLDYITKDKWCYLDEGFVCDECYKFHRFNDGWGGSYMNYMVGDGWFFCEDCLKEKYKEEYLEQLIDNPKSANTILSRQDLYELGFERINEYHYANGLYHGENDNPETIYKRVKEMYSGCEFVFSIIKNYNPFHTEFDVWKREVA